MPSTRCASGISYRPLLFRFQSRSRASGPCGSTCASTKSLLTCSIVCPRQGGASCPSSSMPVNAASGSIGCARPMGLVGLPSEASIPSGWFIAALASPVLSNLCLLLLMCVIGTQRGSARHSLFLRHPSKSGNAPRVCIQSIANFFLPTHCTAPALHKPAPLLPARQQRTPEQDVTIPSSKRSLGRGNIPSYKQAERARGRTTRCFHRNQHQASSSTNYLPASNKWDFLSSRRSSWQLCTYISRIQ